MRVPRQSPFLTSLLAISFAALPALAGRSEATTPAGPPSNPNMANSTFNIAHTKFDLTPLAGPVGPTRDLTADAIQWKEIGPVNGYAPLYSAPYPNGKRVVWVGGYDRVTKLDADTLEILTTLPMEGVPYFLDEEIERHIATMDKLDGNALLKYAMTVSMPPFRSAVSFYRMLSKENELYLPYRSPDGRVSLRVYGDADPSNPTSPIQQKREWILPTDVTTAGLQGMNMTFDGEVILVTQDGTLFAVAHDLSGFSYVKLPKTRDIPDTPDPFSSFVRNSISVDDHGGIYVVTRDSLHRIQWTGKKLSLDEVDGAWSVPYPSETGRGSGTTPSLMGWGPSEDHLTLITDDSRSNNMMAFWRDAIPADWKGLPGFPRRVAAITPVHFDVSKNEQPQIENAPVIYGYDAFVDASYPLEHLADQGGPAKQFVAETFLMNLPGHEGRGGTKIRWDPRARTLNTIWRTQTNFAASVCNISSATKVLYCWGARDGEWTLEGVNWETGESAFHFTLGRSFRFDPIGGPVTVAPNGAVDCGCSGGMGMVRVKPNSRP